MPGTSHSGRRKNTEKAHRLAGTYQKCRHAGRAPDPDPPVGRPPPPVSLVGDARAEWDRMTDRLERSRTLATVDDAVLYQYCSLFAETEGIRVSRLTNARLLVKLDAALEKVQHEDQIAAVATAIGRLQALDAKHLQQLRLGHMALRQYLVEFGMTPAARTKVAVLTPASASTDADPFAEFDEPQGQAH